MSSMFEECTSLESINFGNNFESQNVLDMSRMFKGCNNLANLDLSNFRTEKVEDIEFMFYGCENLKK